MLDFLFFFSGIALILALVLALEAKRSRDFRRRWPPISDDEFVAKCSPGTNRERALKVRRIISEQLGLPYQRIHPDQSFIEDLDCCN
ncbi:Acyl carrier protein [Stieleria neptunia]|uniref:Acyl carrier protein n=1 Tax=Stieleria neptunia TaxID=2527979 RepID=A0A518HX19_9BACT|nr:hypothetical protein [Stieleria neptunia]QDV45400.1 Acyl carrier protein [Stieleria neptunia]